MKQSQRALADEPTVSTAKPKPSKGEEKGEEKKGKKREGDDERKEASAKPEEEKQPTSLVITEQGGETIVAMEVSVYKGSGWGQNRGKL